MEARGDHMIYGIIQKEIIVLFVHGGELLIPGNDHHRS